ncbi:putative ubiquitinyl hydrolase 1 [Helianthus annuus]|nr:putative ubiquitinyl hydrolase 1 [Helianthus annuus]KAJ0943673.1 putative ubiquitinyl hydrolase 1 [Helianthus annuus]
MFISKRKHEPAHYMLKIESFSPLSEVKTSKIESDVFEARGHKWRLDLYPNGNNEENGANHIALYVCDANGHRTRFHENETTWGFDKLISLESFMEGKNGYLFDDSCVFGAEVFEVPEFTQLDRCLSLKKPPATIHSWTINKVSAVTEDEVYSEVFKVGKVKWKLSLFPKGLNSVKDTHLSIFLNIHDTAAFPNDWKVYAKFKIRVKSQAIENDIEKETDNWFSNSVDSSGFPTIMTLSQLNDSENGFLLNDNLTVEVEILGMGVLKYFV